MHILGITGGIATGKSTVTRMLADLGAPTLSADFLAHGLLAPGSDTARAVLRAFPSAAAWDGDGAPTVDRRALGRLVFADSDARRRLESLTHPPIIDTLATQARSWRSQTTACAGALEIPLLFEAGLRHLVDRVVVVACRPETQTERLRARTGMDEAEAQRRIDAQWPLARKIAEADDVLATDEGLEDTRRQVLALWRACCDMETHAPHD